MPDNRNSPSSVSVPNPLQPGPSADTINVDGIEISWDTRAGTCSFRSIPVAMMWVDSTLAGLMAGLEAMVGPERFNLALQAEGRKSVESDWLLISAYSDFAEGFEQLNLNARVAGWGDWQLVSHDMVKQECIFRVYNNWESSCQKALGVCWGSGMLAGKLAGICTKLFKVNCWATQTAFFAQGDAYDEFVVAPSARSLEEEIERLLESDQATRADMAIALNRLRKTEHELREEIAHRAEAEAEMRRSEEWYRLLLHASDGIHILDETGNVIEASDSFCRMLGYSREEVIGMNVSVWDANFSPDKPRKLPKKQINSSHVPAFETKHHRKDGGMFDVEVTCFPVTIDDRAIIFNSSRDITERKQAEAQLLLAANVFTHSQEGIVITDAKNRIVDINPAFTRITGYAKNEVLGQTPKLLASGRHSPEYYLDMWTALHRDGSWRGEIWNRRKTGEIYAEMLSISTIHDETGALRNYIAVFSDITLLKKHEAELDRLAYYDALTGVPNRRQLGDRLEQAIAHAHRSGQALAVCYLDLDGFKPVNDLYGHEVGDRLLVRITEHLRMVLRAEDTLARLGGDEFVLLFTRLDRPDDTNLILERVLAAARSPVELDGTIHRLSASIGVTLCPPDTADADILLRHADQAMFRAKQAGRNTYHLYDPDQDYQLQIRRQKQKRLGEALARGELVLYYQPKIDLFDRTVYGVEALIRWQHPDAGLLPPGDFLPYLEDSELEIAVGEWVIESALCQLSQWNAQGLRLAVSVNVSPNHLLRPDFAPRLQSTLGAFPQVAAGDLELEILENAALGDIKQAARTLAACRELGVHFALDDFGTGYSSLTYLRTLPVDNLKIDQSFVRDMLDDSDAMDIVESVVKLAQVFHRSVIAEGVETLEHGALLKGLGCRYGQGFGIARPMPASAVHGWLEDWPRQGRWADAYT